MSEASDGQAQERALWQRWSRAEEAGLPPDALRLAEFAEGRLTGAARASVEAFLAANPEIAADVAAARDGAGLGEDEGADALIARASLLVPAAGATILPFRPARPKVSAWPNAARW